VKVLSRVFRGKFVAGLTDAFRRGRLVFPGDLQRLANDQVFRAFLRPLFRQDWVVYAKPPFGGPEHVLHYLARYTHRVAISNHRLINVTDEGVTFRWKDYAHGSRVRSMTVSADEFLRRLCLHVLPRGFVRIRFYGFLAARRRAHDLPLCRRVLVARALRAQLTRVDETARHASWPCPRCGGVMLVIERLTGAEVVLRSLAERSVPDTS
jgi:hypothetical protein